MSRTEREKGARFEREIAEVFGTRRVSVQGRSDAEHADVEHKYLWLQCKRRARVGIYGWWEEAKSAAAAVGKMPVLAVRQDRGEALVVVNAKTFAAMLLNLEVLGLDLFNEAAAMHAAHHTEEGT